MSSKIDDEIQGLLDTINYLNAELYGKHQAMRLSIAEKYKGRTVSEMDRIWQWVKEGMTGE